MFPRELLKPDLFRWQFRQVLPVNTGMCCLAVLYALLHSEPILPPGNPLLTLTLIFHSGLVVWIVGRTSTRTRAFLYAAGYSRDQLCFQSLLASAASALLVCLPVWLIMVTGLRFWVQDSLLDSPNFLLIGSEENSMPVILLLEYFAVMLLMHYAWIRAAQNTSDATAGWYLMCLGICFLFWGTELAYYHRFTGWMLKSLFFILLAIVALLLLACFRVHRSAEVRS